MSTITQRSQRTTAGQTSKYADYSVVSFPQLKKHSIIKSSLVNIDPLSPVGAQVGNIKAYGERKKLMVIKTGTRQEMEEISSRFSKESGSEEIFIPERECEHPFIHDIRQQPSDGDIEDDDEYMPTTHPIKKSTQLMAPSERKQTTRITTDILPLLSASGFDKDDDEDFDRILPSPSRSTITKMVKRKKGEMDNSSLSASSDSEHEDRWSKNKENLIKANVDLASLKNKKPKKKKQRTDPVIVQQSDVDYKALAADIELLKKRTSKLEKVYGIIKKNTSFEQTRSSATSNSQGDLRQDTLAMVKDIFGVDPTTLKSPINRPTKVMRELYKNSGHDLAKWKEFFEPNESVLKDFIQQKCLILPEDIPHTWSTIINSMTQMPYDAVKYKQKSNVSTTSTIEMPTDSTTTDVFSANNE